MQRMEFKEIKDVYRSIPFSFILIGRAMCYCLLYKKIVYHFIAKKSKITRNPYFDCPLRNHSPQSLHVCTHRAGFSEPAHVKAFTANVKCEIKINEF